MIRHTHIKEHYMNETELKKAIEEAREKRKAVS